MSRTFVQLVFECGFDERDAVEVTLRGYRSHVWVEVSDGTRYPLTFFDPTRLLQELRSEEQAGRPFLAEPGLIVLTEVTRERMESAVRTLVDEGFFEPHPPGPVSPPSG